MSFASSPKRTFKPGLFVHESVKFFFD